MAARNSTQSHRNMKAIHQSVGRRIAQLRQKKGLTQAELAQRCGLPLSRLARIERGQAQVTFLTLVAIAEQLGTEVHKLLQGIA